jgi:hypothetical protein
VATVHGQPIGLAMLGVRKNHTWITRLGVVPGSRHLGAGEALMRRLIHHSCELNVETIGLEVIQNNVPAYRLFKKLGFTETRDLLILRRPPGKPNDVTTSYKLTVIDVSEQVKLLLGQRQSLPSWLDELPSLLNAGNLHAIKVELDSSESGWLVYQKTIFQLGRIVIQTVNGDPVKVGTALIQALHSLNPIQDTKTENLPRLDPHLKAFYAMNYLESFSRIEMHLHPAL